MTLFTLPDSEVDEHGYSRLSFETINSTLNNLRKIGYRITQTELNVKSKHSARASTLSGKYGEGSFPFHSDFAFRAVPPKYIILCNPDNIAFERATLVCDIEKLSERLRGDISRSTWNLLTINGRCVIDGNFRFAGKNGLRWDCDFLSPANSYAIRAAQTAAPEMLEKSSIIKWLPKSGIIIDNWRCTHAREIAPDNFDDTNRRLIRYEAWDNGRMVSR